MTRKVFRYFISRIPPFFMSRPLTRANCTTKFSHLFALKMSVHLFIESKCSWRGHEIWRKIYCQKIKDKNAKYVNIVEKLKKKQPNQLATTSKSSWAFKTSFGFNSFTKCICLFDVFFHDARNIHKVLHTNAHIIQIAG